MLLSLNREHTFAVISFEEPLAANDKVTIVVSQVLTHVITAHPKQVAQNDKQRMKFEGNVYLFSAYPSAKTKTTLSFPNEEITITGSDVTTAGNKATFGPSSVVVPPFSKKVVTAHYTNNARFLTTERLSRTLEVSHWGNNLAVEEFYDVSTSFTILLLLLFFPQPQSHEPNLSPRRLCTLVPSSRATTPAWTLTNSSTTMLTPR